MTRLTPQFQLKKSPWRAVNLSAILLALMFCVGHCEVTPVSTTTTKDQDGEPETNCPCFPCGYACPPLYYPPPPPSPPLPPPSPLPPAPPCLFYPPPLYPSWPWPRPPPNYPVYTPEIYPVHPEDDYSSGARLSYLVWFPAFAAAALLLMWSRKV